MTSFNPYEDSIKALLMPRIIRLHPPRNLFVAAFSLMKLLPAYFILKQAIDNGLVNEDTTIVESSSGTFALGLALVCRSLNLKLIIVGDRAIDTRLRRRLHSLGTSTHLVHRPDPLRGLQGARLQRLDAIRKKYPNHYWPAQYSNPNNPASYARIAALIVQTLGTIDFIVGPVGSGGSMCGTVKNLRLLNPRLHAVAVDTFSSVLFGLPNGIRPLRGLGNSLQPHNLDHQVFDEVHWVSARASFSAANILHSEHRVFAGPTTGAAYLVAHSCAIKNPGATVLFLAPDEGGRYSDTVYSPRWIRANGFALESLPTNPLTAEQPAEAQAFAGAGGDWARLFWNRRKIEEVIGCQA
jgi:cysteine synthase A